MKAVVYFALCVAVLVVMLRPVDGLVLAYGGCYAACMAICLGGAGAIGAGATVATGGVAVAAAPAAVPTAISGCATGCAGICVPAVAAPV
uniref:Uncharacterized protein n=1 Tax=Acrobeloides nanus TaxID=290746 RepID=A0A914DHW7_9BILA